jgi:hypothetical protein
MPTTETLDGEDSPRVLRGTLHSGAGLPGGRAAFIRPAPLTRLSEEPG